MKLYVRDSTNQSLNKIPEKIMCFKKKRCQITKLTEIGSHNIIKTVKIEAFYEI